MTSQAATLSEVIRTGTTLDTKIPDRYHDNGAYLSIQRGEDWWDPWYLSLEDSIGR